MELVKPMLAPSESIKDRDIKFPVYASPKLDGIRATVQRNSSSAWGLYSRSLKPIPNKHTQWKFGIEQLAFLDGELAVGALTDHNLMQNTTSGVMTVAGEPDVTFNVFDVMMTDGAYADEPFERRLGMLREWFESKPLLADIGVRLLPQVLITSIDRLYEYESEQIALGYEGTMLRSMTGVYLPGRRTLKQNNIHKRKPFVDATARIIGFQERMHNANEATINELGLTQRSSHKENLHPTGMVGAFICEDIETGVQFNIGTFRGMTNDRRKQIWDNQSAYLNWLIDYRTQPTGVVNAPRIPVGLNLRHPDTVS